ncbi:MAG: pilus assembly protein [Novosphingobium sp.]|nr:pilus assembly protein [Novosphingobium sp.]
MNVLRAFCRDDRGAAAAEMALVLPMLMALLFGGMEGGNFFWREHQVVKAAREGARFASRQPLSGFDCTDGSIDAAVVDVATIAAVTKANLVGDADVTVSVGACVVDSQRGIYATQPNGAPVVTVTVQMAYQGLFATMIFDEQMTLGASAQSAVMGL